MSAQPSPVHLSPEQRSGATMLRPAEQPAHKTGLPFTRITRAEFDAAPGRSRTADMFGPVVVALHHGECVRVDGDAKRQPALRQQLRKAAERRGFHLQIKSGPDYLLVRKVDPPAADHGQETP
jgi:hypothetical protein